MHLRRCLPFILLLSTATAWSEAPLQLQAAQIKALGIQTQAIDAAGSGRNGTLPARVLVPNEQMRLVAAPVAGMIELLAVAPGSNVRRGQVLARLSSPQALELQRDALQASSQSGLMQQNLKRDEALFAEGLIAESRLQASRSAASQAAAQASERQQGLALAGIAPGKLGGPLALVSPIDGVVLEQGVQLGQRVETSALIYRVARLNPLWLEIQAPPALAAGLRTGMPVQLAGSELSGKLIAIGRAIDPASQTILLRAEIGKGADSLTPGQVIDVALPTAASGQQVPTAALVRHAGQTYAFVQGSSDDKGTRFEARAVRILSQGGENAVVDGLKAGEKIAVKGVSGLKAMLTGVGKE